MGVSTHNKFKYCCVIKFAGGFIDSEENFSEDELPQEETLVAQVETVQIGMKNQSDEELEKELKGPVGLYQGGRRQEPERHEVSVRGGVGVGRHGGRPVGNPNSSAYRKPGFQRNPPPPPGYVGGGGKISSGKKSPVKKYMAIRKKSTEQRKASRDNFIKQSQSRFLIFYFRN